MAEKDASEVSADEEAQRILCPFSLSDHRFYFWTTWRHDSFDIIITDGGVAWEGSGMPYGPLRPFQGLDLTRFVFLSGFPFDSDERAY